MRELRSLVVLFPNLDRLVRLSRNQTSSRSIKRQRHDSILGIQTTRLNLRFLFLKVVTRLVIPKVHGPIVTTRNYNSVIVHGQGVYHHILLGFHGSPRLQQPSILALPLFQTVRRTRHEGMLKRRLHQGPDTLLMVRQCGKAFSRHQIPHFDGTVVTARDNLWVRGFGQHRGHRVVVPRQTMQLRLGAHIPDTGHGVPSARDQNVQCGMQC